MVQQEVIMENFTSPAARRPYPGTNAIVHTTGFTMVIHVIMWMHISALVLSIPPRIVTGLTKIYTIRQLTIITASAMTQSFFYVIDRLILSAGTKTLAYDSHQAHTYSDGCDTIQVLKDIGHCLRCDSCCSQCGNRRLDGKLSKLKHAVLNSRRIPSPRIRPIMLQSGRIFR